MGNSNEQPSKKFSPMAKSQLMRNYFLVGQGEVLSNIPVCQTNLQNLASSFGCLCDVKTSYVLRAMPYVGKEDRPQVGIAEHVVMSLMN